MGEILAFPIERTKPHVCLSWDDAWERYCVAAYAKAGKWPIASAFVASYEEALDQAVAIAAAKGLPLVDLVRL